MYSSVHLTIDPAQTNYIYLMSFTEVWTATAKLNNMCVWINSLFEDKYLLMHMGEAKVS